MILLGAATVVFLYVMVKIGGGYMKSEGAPKTQQRAGLLVAVCSGVLAVSAAAFLATVAATHESTYQSLVWKSLEANYGITASVDQQGFTAATPFAALLDGEPASCTATPPSTVVCDGVAVPAHP